MSEEKHRQEARRWLLQARADMRAAQGSLESGSYEWACFQSQQAGEKALKALWYLDDADPWGHSLVKLIQDFPDELVRNELNAFIQHAMELDRLYVPTRYPNGLPDLAPTEAFSSDDAEKAAKMAQEIVDFVGSKSS